MKIILVFLFSCFALNAISNENEYSAKIRRFCTLRKGINVRGGGCNQLVEAYMKKFNLVPVRRTVIDSTNSTQHLIQAGDYLFFYRWQGEHGRVAMHFAVVIEVKDGKFRCAEQNVRGYRGVQVDDKFYPLKTLSGQVEVYGYKKGKFRYDHAGALRPK